MNRRRQLQLRRISDETMAGHLFCGAQDAGTRREPRICKEQR